MNQQSPSMFNAALESMTEAEMKERAAGRYGAQTAMVIDAYRQVYPGVKPGGTAVTYAQCPHKRRNPGGKESRQRVAPAYMYLFQLANACIERKAARFPLLSKSHLVFNNTDVSAFATGGTAEARELGGKCQRRLDQFRASRRPESWRASKEMRCVCRWIRSGDDLRRDL